MWVAADESVSKEVGKESPKSKGEKKDITDIKYKCSDGGCLQRSHQGRALGPHRSVLYHLFHKIPKEEVERLLWVEPAISE